MCMHYELQSLCTSITSYKMYVHALRFTQFMYIHYELQNLRVHALQVTKFMYMHYELQRLCAFVYIYVHTVFGA